MEGVIKGLKVLEHKNNHYYYTGGMIINGMFVQRRKYSNDEPFIERIEICFLSSNNAEIFTLYIGTLLEQIQLYRILKDILEIYSNNNMKNFRDILDVLSSEYTSSSMQTNGSSRLEIRAEIQDSMYCIKEFGGL